MRIDDRRSHEEAILMEIREPVRRFLNRMLHDPEMAEDAQSETLLAVIQRLRAGLEIRRPISFALQVAWSKALEVQRRARPRPDAPPAAAPFARDPARMAEIKDWLESGLAALKPIERAVLHLRYAEDLNYREIARVLGQPVGTIGRELHDARKALRASLEKTSGERVTESVFGALLPLMRGFEAIGTTASGELLTGSAGHVARAASRFSTSHSLMLGIVLCVALGAGTWLVMFQGKGERPDLTIRNEGPRQTEPRDTVSERSQVATAAPARAPRFTVTGRVVDESGKGVAGATVHWRPVDDVGGAWDLDVVSRPGAGGVTAGAGGEFELEIPPPHTLARLVSTAPDLAPSVKDGVRAGARDIVLRMMPGLTIGGAVMDLEGAPVVDATVTYHARIGAARVRVSTKSGRDGRYLLATLPIDPSVTRPDAGALVVESSRHAPQVKPIGMALPGARPHSLDLDVWLANGSVLEGVVRDRDSGLPVADAAVELWINSAFEAPSRPGYPVPRPEPAEAIRLREARTDQSGRYRFERVPVRVAGIEPGSRFGAPFRPERPPVLAGGLVVGAPGRGATGAIVPLATADGAVVTVDVALEPGIVLTGSVRDAMGAPIAGADVRIQVEGRPPDDWMTAADRIRGRPILAAAVSDAGGNWRLGDLAAVGDPARLVVVASASGRDLSQVTLGALRESRRAPDLVLADAIPIVGTVVDERGITIPGAVVTIEDPSFAGKDWGRASLAAATDREGRFRFERGRRADGGADLDVIALGFSRARVTMKPGAPDGEVQVAMVRERILRGTVLSSEGKPAAGAMVTAYIPGLRPDGTPANPESDRSLALSETSADATGAFVLGGLPPGRVRLWVGVPWPRNDGLMGLLLGRKFVVAVSEPANSGAGAVTLPQYTADRGSLVVRVVDADGGTPILHDLTGTLLAADGMIAGFGMFSGPGHLVFDCVPAGTYSLVVESRAHPRVATDGIKIGDPTAPSEVHVRLGRGVRLAGRVSWTGELPPGEIHLVAKPDAANVVAVNRRCGRDGVFDLVGLAPGKWRLVAELKETGQPPAMTTRPLDLVIETGKASPPLDLRLLAIGDVKVRLTGAFAEGLPPTMDKTSVRYGDTLRKLEEFRIRCRDEHEFHWFDATVSELAFGVEERDLIVRLPLPEGSYVVAIDHDGDELGTLRISCPGTAEIAVPGP